jgi:DNA modification methylase
MEDVMENKNEKIKNIKLSEIIFDESIYPRKTHNISKVQEYANNMESIEAMNNFIHISKNKKLLDGRHRHLAYLKNEVEEIQVYQHDITDSIEEYKKAIILNSSHGQQLSQEDKKQNVLNLYSKHNQSLETIAKLVSIRKKQVLEWTKVLRENEENILNEKIFDMYMQCYSSREIGEKFNLDQKTILNKINKFEEKSSAELFSSNFQIPLYNIWSYAKCSNSINHFGKTEQNILDNLLYLYTEPFDIVLDPFAGGGSTIDVCKKRLRRYYVSDRKPIVERENEIRKLDIVEELPRLNKRWSEVTLTYLDPPYWKQAENQYSKDKEDLANQSLEEFTKNICSVVDNIAKKQSKGVISLIIQPTQWKADNKEFTDHVFQIINGIKAKNLILENRVSCPYSTQQCTPQMVNWAKENKKLLVLSRELIIWRIV